VKNYQVSLLSVSPRTLWVLKERSVLAAKKAMLADSFCDVLLNLVNFNGKDFVSYVVPPALHNALC